MPPLRSDGGADGPIPADLVSVRYAARLLGVTYAHAARVAVANRVRGYYGGDFDRRGARVAVSLAELAAELAAGPYEPTWTPPAVPRLDHRRRRGGSDWDEDDPGFEDAVRVVEDR